MKAIVARTGETNSLGWTHTEIHMKLANLLACLALAVLGIVLFVKISASREVAIPSNVQSAGLVPQSNTVSLPPPIRVSNSDAARVEALQKQVADLAANYQKTLADSARSRDLWKQRWSSETAASKTEQSTSDLKISEAEKMLKETEERLKIELEAAKAEIDRAKREQADQAAIVPAKQPTPTGASDF